MFTSNEIASETGASLTRKIYSWEVDSESTAGLIETDFSTILHCSVNIGKEFDPMTSVGVLRAVVCGSNVVMTGIDPDFNGTIEIVGTL